MEAKQDTISSGAPEEDDDMREKYRLITEALTLLLVFFVFCGGQVYAQEQKPLFSVRGLGGGGGMYTPSISPHDDNFILLSCDMGGVYRSLDRGASWRMLHWKEAPLRAHFAPPPVFFPNRVFWVSDRRVLCFSDDKGASWTMLPKGPWENVPKGKNKGIILSFAVLEGAEEQFLVSTNRGIWFGQAGHLQKISDKQGGPVLRLGNTLLAVAGDGTLLKSIDRGATWHELAPLPGKAAALAGAISKEGDSLLLVSIENQGIYRSKDMGDTWQVSKAGFANERAFAMPQGQTQLAYAAQTGKVDTQQLLQTKDGGIAWTPVFHMRKAKSSASPPNVQLSWLQTELHWGYYFTRNSVAVSSLDHNFCLVTTQGELFASKDGGVSWTSLMANPLPPLAGDIACYQSIGLEVTSCWGYYFDPIDPNREYIAYTDVGFARSLDKGASWSWSAKGSPWKNTFYDLALDPDIPGKIYAAASNRHDIPHYTNVSHTFPRSRLFQGGVVLSTNWGETWATPYKRKAENALPRQTCTTIALDPHSPPEARVLYAGMFGEQKAAGVYISLDGGQTWRQTEGQPGVLPNRHVYKLRIHPVTRDLYCLITGYRAAKPNWFNPAGGGIWVSSDQGKNWRHISKGSRLNRWATSFAFDPANAQGLYVSAATPQGGTGAGGIYATTDGGKTWHQIFNDKEAKRLARGAGYDHWMAIAVHPDNANLLFAGSTLHGLFFSRNKGKTWQWCRDYPFQNVQSITFNPRNTDAILITTFGAGVWSASVKEILKSH